MNNIKIGDKDIGIGFKPYFIGEIGINHNGSLTIAKQLIDMAADIGIESVKFQKRDFKNTIIQKQLSKPYVNRNSFGNTYLEHKEFLEFSDRELVELSVYTKEKGLDFGCSAFNISSYDFIENKINPVYHKIASPLVVNHELLMHVASYGKPLILSTGMCTYIEIRKAIEIIKPINNRIILMQCTSLYPTEDEEVNLRIIKKFYEDFNVVVGFSSHDKSVVFPAVATAYGARVFEKHITLDRTMKGPDHSSSFERRGLELSYKYIKSSLTALGSEKKEILSREEVSRNKHMQSIVASVNIPKGTVISRNQLIFKSPGTGIMPYEINRIIGKITKRDIDKDEIILLKDLI